MMAEMAVHFGISAFFISKISHGDLASDFG
jgi:hypothetical protein